MPPAKKAQKPPAGVRKPKVKAAPKMKAEQPSSEQPKVKAPPGSRPSKELPAEAKEPTGLTRTPSKRILNSDSAEDEAGNVGLAPSNSQASRRVRTENYTYQKTLKQFVAPLLPVCVEFLESCSFKAPPIYF